METSNNTALMPALGHLPILNDKFIVNPNCSADHVALAKALALKAHAEVYYQPENIPYTTHLYKVLDNLQLAYDGSFDLIFAATLGWLHDVVEDTSVTLNNLHEQFPDKICNGVSALTKNKLLSKAEQMTDSINRILMQPKEVALVKMADRIANLSNPQLCWTIEKKYYYLNEASLILEKLAFSGKMMAQQLEKAIKSYENRVYQVINKVENKVVLY